MSRKHRDLISVERDETQQVSVTIGQTTAGGREVDGGYSQLFNRVMHSGIFASLPLPARAVYTAMVYLGDNTRHFIVDGKDGRGVNIDRIMAVSGCGETAVKQAIKVLADRQLVRILRKGGSTPDGTRFASIYQLLIPVAGYENLHKSRTGIDLPVRNTAPYPGTIRPGTESQHDPKPRRFPTPNPVAAEPRTGAHRVRSNRSDRNVDNITIVPEGQTADDKRSARAALIERGVKEPLLSQLVSQAEPSSILKHVLDFDIRNKLPGQSVKTAGWLVKSILVPYQLHERTIAEIESESRAQEAKSHRRLKDIEKSIEDERAAALNRWVEEQFANADDEELESLRQRVLSEYATLARGLEKVDPRTHPRLSRLIKAVLSQFYQPAV
jgi:hypothetical protein